MHFPLSPLSLMSGTVEILSGDLSGVASANRSLMRERPETLRTDTPWMTTNIPDISLVGLTCFES
jgi:hypothetical protein